MADSSPGCFPLGVGTGAQVLSIFGSAVFLMWFPRALRRLSLCQPTRGGTSREYLVAQVWKWRISALLTSQCPELSCVAVVSPEEAEKCRLDADVKTAAANDDQLAVSATFLDSSKTYILRK